MPNQDRRRETDTKPQSPAPGAVHMQFQPLQAIQADFQAICSPAGQPADKAFFDDLSGDITLG